MATLLDIASVSELIPVPGKAGQVQEIEVFGVSAEGIAYLFQKFPELRMLMTGKSLDTDRLSKLAPEAIAAVIACSCGNVANKKAEVVAARLPLETQMLILDATIRLTMPGGLAPFVERLAGLASLMGVSADSGASTNTAPVTN
jgi:hypothetical protein